MIGKISRFLVLCIITAAVISCGRGNTGADNQTADSLEFADSLDNDSTLFFEEEDNDGLSMEEVPTEVFGDFIFAFTHDKRFQAQRVRFPLPITELNGTERTLNSGKQFRSEFLLPGNDYYTILLGDRSQMKMLESDTILDCITMQVIELEQQNMKCYKFTRNDGRWYLTSSNHTGMPQQLSDFMKFYGQFVADSVFQLENVAEQLRVKIGDEEEEEEDEIVGTIERGQWPAFRPEMPENRFVNIDFGQDYPNPTHILMLQCGISNSMMNTFDFRRDNSGWKLMSYEN